VSPETSHFVRGAVGPGDPGRTAPPAQVGSLRGVRGEPGDEFSRLVDNAAEVGLAWNGPPVVERRTVELSGGGDLSALVWGEGPPEILLVHGRAQNAHTWDTVALALGRPLVAVDLPGHGHSDWRGDHDYSPEVLAGALGEAIEVFAREARLVVGMSLGGLASIRLAATRPELVGSLVLVDITPGVDAAKARAVTGMISGPETFGSFGEILDWTVRHNQRRSLESLRRGVLHNAFEAPDGSWVWRWDPRGRSIPAAGTGATPVAELWDDLGRTRMPLALVRGSRSQVVDDSDVAELLARRPTCRVFSVEGAGHSVQGDRPVELAYLLETLVASSAGPGPAHQPGAHR